MAATTLESSPMAEINATPLIDVLLVLLVMFIITIPLQTHAVELDLPADCTRCPPPDLRRNKVVITNEGAILWNGIPMSMQALAHNLALTARMTPEPELHLHPASEARYDIVDEVLALTKRAGVERMGFVGNEAYRKF